MENIAFLKPLLSSELKIIKMLKCLKYHLCPGLNITVKPVLRWPNTVFTPTLFPGSLILPPLGASEEWKRYYSKFQPESQVLINAAGNDSRSAIHSTKLKAANC